MDETVLAAELFWGYCARRGGIL